jgi:hypothetical protein
MVSRPVEKPGLPMTAPPQEKAVLNYRTEKRKGRGKNAAAR